MRSSRNGPSKKPNPKNEASRNVDASLISLQTPSRLSTLPRVQLRTQRGHELEPNLDIECRLD